MTNEEYKERRQALGLAIAALDKKHLEDREFTDGDRTPRSNSSRHRAALP